MAGLTALRLFVTLIAGAALLTSCKQEASERTSNRSTKQSDTSHNQEASKNEGAKNTASNDEFVPQDLDKEDIKQDNVSNDFFQLLEAEGKEGPGSFVKNFRSSSEFFTRMDQMQKGMSPHGWVRIWYSSNIKDIIGRAAFEAPVGTVAIKKYQTEEKSGYAVMIKKEKNFDKKNGDWHYELRDETGSLLADPAPGKIEQCISCHTAAAEKDYLAGTTFGMPPVDTATDSNIPPTTTVTKGPGSFKTDFGQVGSQFFTETTEFLDGKGPHGKVRIWYSNNIKSVIESSKFKVPEGTVAVKEFDNDDNHGVDGVAVMVKKAAGYDTAGNDWYYELRDKWGAQLKSPMPGKIAECRSCHAAANATDFLAGTKLARDAKPINPAPGKFQFDYFDSNNFFTNMNDLKKGSGHGDVQIFYSASLKNLVRNNNFDAPEGSVAIARYSKDNNLGLVVMTKMPAGYDDANKNWRYEVRDRYGNLLWNPRPGPLEDCIACHRKSNKTDFLGGTKLN